MTHSASASSPAPQQQQPDGKLRPQRRPVGWWLKNLYTAGLVLVVGALFIAGVGAAQRLGWISAGGSGGAPTAGTSQEIYTCPMHPQIRQPGPGRCPICGMELVPAAGGGAELDELSIRIEPAQRRLANIRTEPVQRLPVTDRIQSIGSIAIDESRMATISSYIAGRIERLFADYTGVDVAKGDHLTVVYSPQLYSAQVEYVEARKSLTTMNPATLEIVRKTQQKLVESARQRLVELGMTGEQLASLEQSGEAQSRLTIYAPIGGTVTQKLVVEGDYVDAGQPIYRIANLSTVWLMLELFPEQASRIRFGQRVAAEIQSLPGEQFQGRVAFIDPTVDTKKRTVGVRVEFLNDDRRLRPGDYATATISLPIGPQGEVYDADLAGKWISPMHPQIIRDDPGKCPICGMELVPTSRYGYTGQPVAQPASLVIPRSAVLLAGNSSVVYVGAESGRFEIRTVTLGPILRDRVIIIDGLKEGEQVATAGNFLIDSQMQLAGKPSLIDPTRAVLQERERKTPLEFRDFEFTAVSGEAGRQLEELFAIYFRIQQSLAADERPHEADAKSLNRLATSLALSEDLDENAKVLLRDIAKQSEHLHHLTLEQARAEAFRLISYAVTTLAARVRAKQAEQPFYHAFCPMVKGGGDWLQSGETLHNPYMGAKSGMLKCGEVVRELPARGRQAEQTAPQSGPVSRKPEGN